MTSPELTFSIIVNTLDRAGPLRTLLRALEAQSYPHFEVVVVPGPCTDDTEQVLADYAGRLRVLRCPVANLSVSRNIGIVGARGDIIVFIDDDAVPCQRWLEQLARIFRDHAVDLTGGSVWAVYPTFSTLQFQIGTYSSLSEQQDVRASWIEYLAPPPGRATQWTDRITGGNMAFRRQALLDIGGFDEFYEYVAEETDINLRMMNAGMRVYPVKEAPIYHVPGSGLNRVMFTNKGRWWMRSRSRVYFGIKNGLAAGESWRNIAYRSVASVGAHLIWYPKLFVHHEISLFKLAYFYAKELSEGINAVNSALNKPRQTLTPEAVAAAQADDAPLIPFQNEISNLQPAVNPVSGYSPQITLTEPPLRLCLLSATYPPTQFGGVGRLTNLMAQGLFELGHTVHVITRGESEHTAFYDGAYVHTIPLRFDHYEHLRRHFNLFATMNYSHDVFEKARRLQLNDGIQLVDSSLWQFEGLVTLHSGILPVVVRLVTGMRQVTAIHKQHVDEFSLMGDLEQKFIAAADYLLPNTQATFDNICKVYDLNGAEGRSTIVPYGIIPAPTPEIPAFRPKAEGEEFTILYVGRLEKRKGITDLFAAIPRVLAAFPNTHFVLAGSDNSQHDGFKLETGMDYPAYFAANYPQAVANVTFRGMVSDEELQVLYRDCDLFVAPSLYESFGLIYLEAMNWAKPVIGCRAGGIPEVVDEGVTGLLVDPEAPAELAEAILSLRRDPEKLERLGQAGRQQILEKFSYLTMARNFATIYRQVIAKFEAERAVSPRGTQA
jgi:glycosyltransferase involved in cell wall biosynthesis